jgi:hypothetical protein
MAKTSNDVPKFPTLTALLDELQAVMDKNETIITASPTPRRFRTVYKPIKRAASRKVLETLIPMEYRVWADLVEHPLSSNAEIEQRTGMPGKSVESAIYRLRRIHGIVESVDAESVDR